MDERVTPQEPATSSATATSTPSLSSTAARLRASLESKLADYRQQRDAERQARLATFNGTCRVCLDEGECDACQRGRTARAVRQTRQREAWVRAVLERAGVRERALEFSFDSYPDPESEALAATRAFLDAWDGRRGIVLIGPYGTGKTGLLVAMLRARLMRYTEQPAWDPEYPHPGWRFVTSPDLFDTLRAGYDASASDRANSFERRLDEFKRARLLAIDDLGAERVTDWVREKLFAIVNHRYEAGLPIWATSNLAFGELAREDRIGQRIVDRLAEVSDVVIVAGPNLRRPR